MTIKAAAIQIAPIEGDVDATISKAEEWLERAAAEGVSLAVIPEGYLPGYADIQAAKKSESPDVLADVLAALDPIPGPATERIGSRARQHGMVVAFGMLARDTEGGKPYNASVLFDADGEIANIHKKVHLTPVYEADDFAAGDDFLVSDTAIGQIGNMVCGDFTLPETTRILAIRGARVLLGSLAAFYMPPPEPRDRVRGMYVNSHCSPTRAIDNAVFMVMANMCGWNSGLEFFGKSRIIAPSGEILAEGGEGAEHEGIVSAEIDPGDMNGGLPFRLMDRRRPDLYEELLAANPAAGEVGWDG